MAFTEISIKRWISICMLMCCIFLFGVIAFVKLPVELMPSINYPQLSVITYYEKVSPLDVETLITNVIEEAVSAVTNAQKITSHSKEGVSVVTVHFNWGTDMNFASLKVREKIDRIANTLPYGAKTPLILRYDPASLPILVMGITGSSDAYTLRKWTEDKVKPALQKIDGVGSVVIEGGLKKEILVEIDLARLKAHQLDILKVLEAIRSANLNFPAGSIKKGSVEYLLRTIGEFHDIADIKKVVVGNGAQQEKIYLKDIAHVHWGQRPKKGFSRVNRDETVTMRIFKRSDANTITVAKEIKKEWKHIVKTTAQVNALVVYDQSRFIRASIQDLNLSIILGIGLAFGMLYYALRNLYSAGIIIFAIPLSLLITFILMFFKHISVNMMSLGGLALGVGMLVDNAIVMLENIYQYREKKYIPLEAAVIGSKEMSRPLIASTFTSIVVFFPLIFVQSVAGELFGHLAFTIIFSLLASLFVAMVFIPMLSAQPWRKKHSSVGTVSENSSGYVTHPVSESAWFQHVKTKYTQWLQYAFQYRKKVFLSCCALFGVSLMLYPVLGKEVLPKVDKGEVQIKIKLPAGTNVETTNRLSKKIEEVLLASQEVKNVVTKVGSEEGESGHALQDGNAAHQSSCMVTLQKGRRMSTKEWVERIRNKVTIPNATLEFNLDESFFALVYVSFSWFVLHKHGGRQICR